jgi:cell division protein FtsB
MNVDLGIWNKLTKLLMGLLLLAGLLGIAGWYLPLIRKNERMRKEIQRLATEEKKEDEMAKQSKAAIDALRNDPKSVERLARQELHYAKPGETIIRFEDPATNHAGAR